MEPTKTESSLLRALARLYGVEVSAIEVLENPKRVVRAVFGNLGIAHVQLLRGRVSINFQSRVAQTFGVPSFVLFSRNGARLLRQLSPHIA